MSLVMILSKIRKDERGSSMLEYALLASLLAVVVIASMGFAGRQTANTFQQTGDVIHAAGGGVIPP